jgi:site-specific recombinase XerD
MEPRNLKPITPERAIEWYHDERHEEVRAATRRAHQSALGIFQDWTDETGLDNLNDLSGRDLVAFKTWRKNETDINTVSLNGTLAVIKRFLRFCETIEAVPQDFAEKVPMPNVPPNEEVRTDVPEDDVVEAIRDYYRRCNYASRQHATFELIAEVGVRLGAVRAIDVDDFIPADAIIHLNHRPESTDVYGTPLKNGSDGERIINLSSSLVDCIQAYVDYNRHDVTDEFDREPLFTTSKGRISGATLRRDFYKLSRPCENALDCPHGREKVSCEATQNTEASDCPSSFSTHPLRKWSIMSQLDEGVPKELLSDRVDVSVPVLDKHYDQRSEERKSRRRREVLEANMDQYAMTDGGRPADDGEW